MKSNHAKVIPGLVAALVTLAAGNLVATDPPAKSDHHTSSGTLSAVDAQGRTLTVKQLLRSRQFNLGSDCTVSVRGEPTATPADLKPGMQVKVTYQNVDGVLVASRVAQRQYRETGSIKSIDVTGRTLVLDRPGSDHAFTVPENCRVVGQGGQPGTWTGLKVGERITVRYVEEKGARIADEIASPHDTRVGTIAAIDTVARTIKIQRLLSTEQFNLADRCRIVVNGNPDAPLNDLRLGEKVVVDYREANGVLIATRIAPAESRAGSDGPGSGPSNP